MSHQKKNKQSHPAGKLDRRKSKKAFHPEIAVPKDGRHLAPMAVKEKPPKPSATHTAERSNPVHGGRSK